MAISEQQIASLPSVVRNDDLGLFKMNQSRIKAVFFDAGGTLFSVKPSVGEIYSRIAQKYGMHTDAKLIEKRFREEFSKRDKLTAIEAHANEKNEKEWWKRLVREVFQSVTVLRLFDDFFEELYDVFATEEVWALYPDAIETVKALRKKNIITGIVSNWDSRLFTICRGMKIEPLFDFILASAVIGFAKPDPRIFERALMSAGVNPGEALHVGDSLENDYSGAKHAGLNAVLIAHDSLPSSDVVAIRSLSQLPDLIN